MRVLHIITGLGVGGAEHQLRLLLKHLPYQSEVLALTNPGAIASAIRGDGTPVRVLAMRGNTDLAILPKLVKIIKAGRYDIVHTHLYRACVYGRLAARLAGVRNVVATEHSLGDGIIEGRPTTRGVRALYLASERLGRSTIAVSDTVRDRLIAWGVPQRRIEVIANGIDPTELTFDPEARQVVRARLGIGQHERVIGALGRLEPTKRFDRLIQAVVDLPDVKLLLVGSGSARAELTAVAERLGIGDRTVFAGPTAHSREMLCAMDIFASPSDQETFGLAVLEAIAAGLPVVYVACPPLQELPPEAAPGARQVASDAVALRLALADELARLPRPDPDADPADRLAIPPAVAHYDITRLAAAVGGLYERIAARPGQQLIGSDAA